MKKTFITIVVVVILACSLVVSASAASFEHLADDLNALGLFRGTDNGYDLDRAPNRVEALVMLLRLYGLEEEALACESDHPFTDVSGWQIPYVAYAFENGYTSGMTDTTFNPGGVCSAQMYVTFVLRALGYSSDEGGDFTYADALDFGMSVGIIDEMLAYGDFLRDQMVAVSYLALSAAPKDGEFDTLFEKLAAAGVLAEDGIAALKAKQALLNEFIAVGASLNDETNVEMKMKASVDMGLLGAMLIDMDMSMIMDGTDILVEMNMVMDMAGEKQEMKIYMADGFMYVDADGDKMKMDIGLSDLVAMLAEADTESAAISIAFPAYLICSITKGADGDLTVYNVAFADGFIDVVMAMAMEMMDGADLGDIGVGDFGLGGMGLGDMGLGDIGFEDISFSFPGIKYYADSDGMLKKIDMDMGISMKIDVSGFAMTIPIKVSCEIEIVAVGDAVKVNLPDDLDEYELVDMEALLETEAAAAAA